MVVTFRVVLYYVGPDNYHVFMSCDVVELGLSSMELDSSLVEICFCLFFVLLRAVLEYSLHFGPSETRYSHWCNKPVLWNLHGTRSNLETFGGKSI